MPTTRQHLLVTATRSASPRLTLRMLADWQQIAQKAGLEMLGTAEGAQRLAESRRYGLLIEEVERLLERIAALEAGARPIATDTNEEHF